MNKKGFVGYACTYTPLPLIHGAGYAPYRVLPNVDCPDQAGGLLHDNLCPHVKRLLDRALSGGIPPLEGMVFMNSCDSIRRLYDAWRSALPGMNAVLVDLPVTADERSVGFFGGEIARLRDELERWSGREIPDSSITEGIGLHNRIARLFSEMRERAGSGTLRGGSATLQEAYNAASTAPPEEAMEFIGKILAEPAVTASPDAVPVYLFGNVMPEPELFGLIESCGARIVLEDGCTGSRLFNPIDPGEGEGVIKGLARGLLSRPACARTFEAGKPGSLGPSIATAALNAGARGIIGYTAKFCDPYIARVPEIRSALREEGIPFLMLEGDCTLRSIGQQKTRIEAFIEMMR